MLCAQRLSVQLMNNARRPVKSAGPPGWVSAIAGSFLGCQSCCVTMSASVTPIRVTVGAFVLTSPTRDCASPGQPPHAARDLRYTVRP
jgi:hypothetical protein